MSDKFQRADHDSTMDNAPPFGHRIESVDPKAFQEEGDIKVQFDNDDDYEAMSAKSANDGKNGMWGTALAIISTIMGGGIVSIPYAYAVAGVGVGISVQVVVIMAIWCSCVLYLRTRNILRCNTSFSVIANLCLGPISGIILNTLLVFAVFGILALYMILFSEIAISLIGTSYAADHFLNHKTFYVFVLSILISPIITRKRIQELKLSTYILFFGVLCLMVLLTAELCINGSYDYRLENGLITAPVVDEKVVTEVSSLEGITDSVNIAVTSQGFVIALFPIYASMAKEAKPRVMSSISIGLCFTMTTYTYLSYISISYFGQENISPSIFDNIKEEDGAPSVILRFLFLIIFFCNIPFVFFAGKLALMAIVHQCFYQKKPATAAANGQDDDHFQMSETVPINADQQALDTSATPTQVSRLQGGQSDAFSTSFISASIKGEVKPEDELSSFVYLAICFGYLMLVALAAIFIDDLTLIFGIIAGLAECTTVFILPSIFYLVARNQERKTHEAYHAAVAAGQTARRPHAKKAGGNFSTFCVYIYLIIGCTYFGISNYYNFAKIFR